MAQSGSLCRALPWQTTGVPQSEMSPSLGFRDAEANLYLGEVFLPTGTRIFLRYNASNRMCSLCT
jgi:hypothetical protein